MKIAVASEDGVSISHHFGRSRCFLVFDVQNKQIVGQSIARTLLRPMHAANAKKGSRMTSIMATGRLSSALRDCEAVLCYGMGWRAAEDLKQNGIQAFVVQGDATPEQAVREYLAGNLGLAGGFCRCHE